MERVVIVAGVLLAVGCSGSDSGGLSSLGAGERDAAAADGGASEGVDGAASVDAGEGGAPMPDATTTPDAGAPPTAGPPAAAGELDPTFGDAGKLSRLRTPARALALDADGKLLVVGGMNLSRYNVDGSDDTGFGNNGLVSVVARGGSLDELRAVAVQGDGKILVAGFSALPTSVDFDIVLARYQPDGSLDATFGEAGFVYTDFSGSTDGARALAVQPDGKILVAGDTTWSGDSPDSDFALCRYLSTGGLDPAFGTLGKASVNIAGTADIGAALALQEDGKIVVAGRAAVSGGSDPDFGIVRFGADGLLDGTFATGGVARLDVAGGGWDEATDVLVDGEGRILAAGFASVTGKYRFALARLDANGARDASFGSNGTMSTLLAPTNDFAYGEGVALAADGTIVVVGRMSDAGKADMGIARYQADGAVDASFGSAGVLYVDFFGAFDAAFDLAIQADGQAVVVGSARNGSTTGLGAVRVGL